MMADSIQELDDREQLRLGRKSLSKSKSARYNSLNRYTNILCYDDSLPTSVEYINASIVQFDDFNCDLGTSKKFIATQAPPLHTLQAFYTMIVEEGARDIIQLSNYRESGRTKVDYYLPDGVMQLEDITVTKKSVQEDAECLTTILDIRSPSKSIQTRHILYKTWPDHSTPKSLSPLISLLARLDDSSPCIVHCSAGVGRSATFIALHEFIRCKNHQLKPFYDDLNDTRTDNADIVYRSVDFIKRQRPLSCEPKQVAWLYYALQRL